MLNLNSICGAILGLAAATVGIVCEPMVKKKLDAELFAKEREIPPVLAPDGTVEIPKRLVINDIDRLENQRRWEAYRQGAQYLMFNAFAFMGLGACSSSTRRGKQAAAIGGVGFTVSALLMALFPIAFGIWDLEILMISAPIGALAFVVGWFAIIVSLLLPKSADPQPELAGC
ncbi:hypothetical protein [Blastopirellula marina]|uniref:DUF423 domain-containing protein n=1 Tax=Blastopirellula marina TaxID=124 RepID=A0A2S8GHZ5_9BACT|nr:hypothetical protein [Blastopirellula marina]PQO44047.1 hypothetical protein C5Y93_21130 [Blastopirellula marina]